MGSENSKQFRDNSLLSFDENSLDYDGIITTEESSIDEENNDEEKDIYQCIPDKNQTNINKPKVDQNKVPITFEWDQGKLCICNWKFLQLGTIFFNGKKTKWKSFLNT